MHQFTRRQGAFAVLLIAAVWPDLSCWMKSVLQSPLERVLQHAWCGSADINLTLAHQAECWAGAATLALTALMLSLPWRPQPARRSRRR